MDVPNTLVANLNFRRRVLREAAKSEPIRHDLYTRCRHDILFWMNTFVWTFAPKLYPSQARYPFITYPYQDHAMTILAGAIGKHDVIIEKARDMGASWMCLMAMLHRWLFFHDQNFILVSRKEEYVDAAGDPKTLFWKVDFALENLPLWMRPVNMVRRHMHLANRDKNNVMVGESTTGDVAAGARPTAILLDEFARVPQGTKVLASTRDATNCRIFNSTPQGTGNAFYELLQTPIQRITLHWTLHPVKRLGLYCPSAGEPIYYPDSVPPPEMDAYGKLGGVRLRSPWYDGEVARSPFLQEIAQELDIDYLGSGWAFFDLALLDTLERETVVNPYFQGDLDYSGQAMDPKFTMREGGSLLLWCALDAAWQPPDDRDYVAGADISAGTGRSNSAIVVADTKTGEKVAEFASPFVAVHEFAKYCAALCRFFRGRSGRGAFLCWERNGPGVSLADFLREVGFGHFWLRRQQMTLSKKWTEQPGFWKDSESGRDLMLQYLKALKERKFINRSRMALHEARYYVYDPSGEIAHATAITATDPSGARENHADRVVADALCCKMLLERPLPERGPAPEDPPEGSLAWRWRERALLRKKKDWWY